MLQLYLFLGGIDVSWTEILLASLFKIIFPNIIDFPLLFFPENSWIESNDELYNTNSHQYIL